MIYTFYASFFGDLLYGATVIFTGFVVANFPRQEFFAKNISPSDGGCVEPVDDCQY